MKRCAALFFSILLLVVMLSGQATLTQQHPGQFNYSFQTIPGPIPTMLTTVYAHDAYLCAIDLEGSGQSILVQDLQVTPVALYNNTLGSSGSVSTWAQSYGNDSSCRYFPGGFAWQAGASGATGYVVLKHN